MEGGRINSSWVLYPNVERLYEETNKAFLIPFEMFLDCSNEKGGTTFINLDYICLRIVPFAYSYTFIT